MATKYFKKLNLANTINDRAGKLIEFESIGDRDRTGVIALDTDSSVNLISDLEKYAEDRVGGVVVISPEIYDDLKKKEVLPQRKSSQLSGLRVAAAPDPFKRPEEKAALFAGAGVNLQPEPPAPSANTFFKRARTRRDLQKPPE